MDFFEGGTFDRQGGRFSGLPAIGRDGRGHDGDDVRVRDRDHGRGRDRVRDGDDARGCAGGPGLWFLFHPVRRGRMSGW